MVNGNRANKEPEVSAEKENRKEKLVYEHVAALPVMAAMAVVKGCLWLAW